MKKPKKSEVKQRTVRQYLMVIVGRTKIPYNDLCILNKDELECIIEGHEIDKRDDWERTRIST